MNQFYLQSICLMKWVNSGRKCCLKYTVSIEAEGTNSDMSRQGHPQVCLVKLNCIDFFVTELLSLQLLISEGLVVLVSSRRQKKGTWVFLKRLDTACKYFGCNQPHLVLLFSNIQHEDTFPVWTHCHSPVLLMAGSFYFTPLDSETFYLICTAAITLLLCF